MNCERIAIIGRLAKDSALLDGQTVKTKILYEELCRRFPNTDVVCVDTYLYRKRMIPLFFQMLGAFIRCKHIFVLLSRNGRTDQSESAVSPQIVPRCHRRRIGYRGERTACSMQAASAFRGQLGGASPDENRSGSAGCVQRRSASQL